MRRFLCSEFSLLGGRQRLRNACAAATLLTGWGAPALAGFEPFDITGWVQPDRPLQSAYLYVHYYAGGGSGCGFHSYVLPLSVPASPGVRTYFSVTVPDGPTYPFDESWTGLYSVIGVYDEEEGAVTLGYHPIVAANLIAAGNEWEYFTSELQVALWMQKGDTTNLTNFMQSVAAPCYSNIIGELGDVSPLVAFSHAVANGTSFFEVECGGPNGDANCDGAVDFFDIDPFLDALFDAAGYVVDGCNGGPCCAGRLCAADANDSGTVDFFDIDPFLACLFSSPECH